MRVYQIKDDKLFKKWLNFEYRVIYDIGQATGLRISDIVQLKKSILDIKEPTIIEQKTGKSKRIYIPSRIRSDMRIFADKSKNEYIFYSEKSKSGHLTRQAVWKQFKQAAEKAKINTNVGTHSMRKKYARKEFEKNGLRKTQEKLNHTHTGDTALYLIDKGDEKE